MQRVRKVFDFQRVKFCPLGAFQACVNLHCLERSNL